MTFKDQLVKLQACPESISWVKDKILEEAWNECKNSEWMLWILSKTDLDLIDPICDIVEEVLDLVPEEYQLACIWAISAARRRANQDELNAAVYAVNDAYTDCYAAYTDFSSSSSSSYYYHSARASDYYAVSAAKYAIFAAAYYADNHQAAQACSVAASSTVMAIDRACYSSTIADVARIKEHKRQCDIFRKYITINQVREAFNKLVA